MLIQCSFSSEKLLEERAEKNYEEKKYSEAQTLYEKLIQKTENKEVLLKAWKRIAELNHFYLKDGDLAHEAYRKVLLYLPTGDDVVGILKSKADLEINMMQRPDLGITSLEKLLLLQMKKEEKIKTLLQLIKIYQIQRRWEDAKISTEQVLELNPNLADWFQVELMRAAALNQAKQFDDEAAIYEDLLKKSPQLSQQHKTTMSLVLSYEQRKKWKEAAAALQKWKDLLPEDIVREKELELKKRISNEPGARGLRK